MSKNKVVRELREMGLDELRKRLDEVSLELFQIKGASTSTHSIENPGRYRELKRTIARIKTLLRERGKLLT